jgi:FKBP-type peptidyl-prolyl cis-trans isomerase
MATRRQPNDAAPSPEEKLEAPLPSAAADGPFRNERDQVSYAFGMSMASAWKAGLIDLDPAVVVQGLKASLAGEALLTETEMTETLTKFGQELRVVQQHHREQQAEENRRGGESFLALNKTKADVVSLPSGLQYKIITQGTGPNPDLMNWVKLKYSARRIDGTIIESSDAHPEASIFGLRSIIQGWAEALQMMQPGSKWRLFVPPSLGYGKDGSPGVGPDETLIYDLELVSILPGQPQPTAEEIKDERGSDDD